MSAHGASHHVGGDRRLRGDHRRGTPPAAGLTWKLKEPYRVEGKKVMGLGAGAQLADLPDVIFCRPERTGPIGMWKAFAELESSA